MFLDASCFSQEAAVGVGYGAAALPLWEEFLIRFFKYETQLSAVVPKQQIANHLQQLAQLYETSSPVLSNIYALLSCLSPDQLPGYCAPACLSPSLLLSSTSLAEGSCSIVHDLSNKAAAGGTSVLQLQAVSVAVLAAMHTCMQAVCVAPFVVVC